MLEFVDLLMNLRLIEVEIRGQTQLKTVEICRFHQKFKFEKLVQNNYASGRSKQNSNETNCNVLHVKLCRALLL